MVKKFDRFEKAWLAGSTSLFGLPSPVLTRNSIVAEPIALSAGPR
jgi:hypothetical protein